MWAETVFPPRALTSLLALAVISATGKTLSPSNFYPSAVRVVGQPQHAISNQLIYSALTLLGQTLAATLPPLRAAALLPPN